MKSIGERLRKNIKDRAAYVTGKSEITAHEAGQARKLGEEIGKGYGKSLRSVGKKLRKK